MEGWETVEEDCVFSGFLHDRGIHLVGEKVLDPLLPYFFFLSHGYPDIRVYYICIFNSFSNIAFKFYDSSCFLCYFLAFIHNLFWREILFRSNSSILQAHFGASYHHGYTHVESGVSHETELDSLQLSKVLFDGKKGCKNLGRVELVRKAIPYRNPTVFCQIFHSFLAKTSVFDAVEHPAKDFGRIADGFLLSDLRPLGVKIHRVHTQVCSSHFKGTAGSCAGLFEDKGYILSFMDSVAYTFFLHFFELCSFIKHISNLFRCKIQKGKKALSFEIYL